ncbi:MAG: HAMP domain-containing protein [Limnobacter sp.]|nr:HAMP domain-containing protein [Limnobacter sp.]
MSRQPEDAAARHSALGRNRLFWKLFIGFWLTLLAAGAAVGVAVWFHQQQQRAAQPEPVLAAGPRTALLLQSAAASLRYGGEAALRALLADADALPRGEATLFAVDRQGQDLLGRPVPADALADAQARSAGSQRPFGSGPRVAHNVRVVESPAGGHWLLFVAATGPDAAVPGRPGVRASPRLRRTQPGPLVGIAIGVLASLAFSGLLAWHLTRPIRHLRGAFASVADGRLETRAAPLMGRRVDEIADLGHDFDLMVERLQKLIVSQRRLLHDVSHELRSPLARLQAAIGLARQSPERSAAMLERIELEAQRLDALVGELLALARLEANATESPARVAELSGLLDEVVADARFEAQAIGKDVRFVEAAGGPAQTQAVAVAAHADWLQRAFDNVIRNAIRHSPPGSSVEVAVAPARANRVAVTIADSGPGVAADELETIFEPFQRGRNAAALGSGYGLGLAIARRAVAAHGGTIVASNRAGGGLLVTIELPTAVAGDGARPA